MTLRYASTVLLLLPLLLPAQTNLGPGDMVFTAIKLIDGIDNPGDNDELAWILLTDAAAGTEFVVTDGEYRSASGLETTESSARIRLNAAAPCGTEFRFSMQRRLNRDYLLNISATAGNPSIVQRTSPWSGLSIIGDNAILYQGGFNVANPSRYIAVVDASGAGSFGSSATGNTDLPPGLTAGQNAIALPGDPNNSGREYVNARYNCTLTTGTPAQLASAASTVSNWQLTQATGYTLGAGCGITCQAACTNPTLTGVSVNPAAPCPNQNFTINIGGALNDAAQYELRTGGCNGPVVASTTGNSINYTVSEPTALAVTVQDCNNQRLCRSFTVNPAIDAARAGPDQLITNYPATLAANSPAPGSGLWTEVAGDGNGSFTAPTNPNSQFSGSPGVRYTLRWTISGAGCPATSDEVEVSSFVANTPLAAGDVLFTYLNTNGRDEFALVLTRDLAAGTSFSITDKELRNGALQAGEGIGLLTFQSNAACGSEFLLSSSASDGNYTVTTATGSGSAVFTTTEGSVQLTTIGESLIAYQGSTYLTALVNCGFGFGNADIQCTDLPPGLTAGTNAFAYLNGQSGPAGEPDNIIYNCSVTAGDAAALGTALSTQSNWTEQLTAQINYAACGFTCLVDCNQPELTAVTPGTTTPCPGQAVNVTVTGNLNGADRWAIFAQDCGPGELASSTTATISFVPPTDGTYFVAGVGGCVVNPSCTPFALTYAANPAEVPPLVVTTGSSVSFVPTAPPSGGQTAVLTFLSGNGAGSASYDGTNITVSGTPGQAYDLELRYGGGSCPPTRDTALVVFAAPSVLQTGDIAFTGINTAGRDGFSFVALRPLFAGTPITFTDRGWDGGFVNSGEATMTLFLTRPLDCGESIYLEQGPASTQIANWTARLVGGTNPVAGTISQQGPVSDFNLNSIGDQVFAYQGAEPTGEAAFQNALNFLAGISTNISSAGTTNADWDNQIASATTDSDLPDVLAGFAVLISDASGSNTFEVANGQYDCAAAGTTNATASTINDWTNWATRNTVPYDLSSSCLGGCDTRPQARCRDFVVQIDDTGTPLFAPDSLNDGSSDDNTAAMDLAFSLDPGVSFDCAGVGQLAQSVRLTVMDNVGQTDRCFSSVTVEDNVAPTGRCRNVAYDLDTNGQFNPGGFSNFALDDILRDFADNCASGPQSTVGAFQFAFNCNDLGDNPELYGFYDRPPQDPARRELTCRPLIQINDPLGVCDGAVTANCQDLSTFRGPDGTYVLDVNDFDAGSVADRGIYSLALSDATDRQESPADDCTFVGTGQGQSFTAGITGAVRAIRVRAVEDVSTTLHLYAGNNGSGVTGSVGTPAYSQAVEVFASGNGGLTTVLLDTPFPVVAGQEYSFVLEGETELYYACTGTPSYTGGRSVINYVGFTFDDDQDYTFQVDLIGPVSETFTADGSYPRTVYAVDNQGNVSAACSPTLTLDQSLPVSWLFFGADAGAKSVDLRWETTPEPDNAGFHVERSPAGERWVTLGHVPPHAGPQAYAYRDEAPLPGRAYYRLRQTDLDGTVTYSPVREVLRRDAGGAVRLFPNPTRGGATLQLPAAAAYRGLYDLRGRRQRVPAVPVDAGLRLDLGVLPRGVYLLRVRLSDGSAVVERVVVQ